MSAKRGSESPGQQPELPRAPRSQRILIADDPDGEYKNSVDKLLSTVVGFDHYLLKPCDPNQLIALLGPLRSPLADDQ